MLRLVVMPGSMSLEEDAGEKRVGSAVAQRRYSSMARVELCFVALVVRGKLCCEELDRTRAFLHSLAHSSSAG